jgi:hypothetical protein
MLLGVGAPTGQALRELLTALEACRPLINAHDPIAIAYAGVDLYRVASHHLQVRLWEGGGDDKDGHTKVEKQAPSLSP